MRPEGRQESEGVMPTNRQVRTRNPIPSLTVQQLWELVTGISVHPDRWSFAGGQREMLQAWHDHADAIRAWRDEKKPRTEIWIEEIAKRKERKRKTS